MENPYGLDTDARPGGMAMRVLLHAFFVRPHSAGYANANPLYNTISLICCGSARSSNDWT